MRTIDADALFDNYLDAMKKLMKSTQYENIGAETISLLCGAKLITDAPTIGGWISVKDRLPENGEFVVVRHEIKGRIYSEVAHYIMDLWWLDWDTNGLELNAISWMPLPEPPDAAVGTRGGE